MRGFGHNYGLWGITLSSWFLWVTYALYSYLNYLFICEILDLNCFEHNAFLYVLIFFE